MDLKERGNRFSIQDWSRDFSVLHSVLTVKVTANHGSVTEKFTDLSV